MALLNKRNIVIGVLVIGVAVALSYRYAFRPEVVNEESLALPREVSAVVSFDVPNGVDTVRFTLGLDSNEAVVSVKTTDVLAGDTADELMIEFSEGLLLAIRGKRLGELGPVDRVGTSSLTTTAFNKVIPVLQAQL